MLEQIFPPSFVVAALYVLTGSLLINSSPSGSSTRTLGTIVLAAASLPAYRAIKGNKFSSDRGKGI